MAELTKEARDAISDAVRIVREDKQYAMLRDVHTRGATADPPPSTDPPKPGETPPPAKTPAEPAKRKGLYWDASLFDEGDAK